MSFNNVQERDLVIAIKESSDEAFVLKKDLEDTKITLNQLAPGVNFKPYAVSVDFWHRLSLSCIVKHATHR